MTLTFYTVDGTLAASDTDPGQYPNQVAVALLPSEWQFVADQLAGLATVPLLDWVPTAYPAAVYPMGASVNTGVAQLITNIQASPLGTPKGLAGYSQGAIVTSTVWRDYILNPSGSLHAYLPDFEAGGSVTWGNPMRAPNVCNGNTYAGWAPQSGGGISGSNGGAGSGLTGYSVIAADNLESERMRFRRDTGNGECAYELRRDTDQDVRRRDRITVEELEALRSSH